MANGMEDVEKARTDGILEASKHVMSQAIVNYMTYNGTLEFGRDYHVRYKMNTHTETDPSVKLTVTLVPKEEA